MFTHHESDTRLHSEPQIFHHNSQVRACSQKLFQQLHLLETWAGVLVRWKHVWWPAFFKDLLNIFTYAFACQCVYAHDYMVTQEGQKRTPDSLVWELQVVVSCPVKGWEPNSCPLKEQQACLTARPSLQTLLILKWLNNWWFREF